MKVVPTNTYISIYTRKRKMEYIDVWIRGLDNVKIGTCTKETGGNRNEIPTENARISWTTKKTNTTLLRQTDTTRSLINRMRRFMCVTVTSLSLSL